MKLSQTVTAGSKVQTVSRFSEGEEVYTYTVRQVTDKRVVLNTGVRFVNGRKLTTMNVMINDFDKYYTMAE